MNADPSDVACFSEHPLLPAWEVARIAEAYGQVREVWPMRSDRDALLVGWTASLKWHGYAGWKGGVAT